MLTLLALPPELIGQILSFLPPADILTCAHVNSHLRGLIVSSIGIQYKLALDTAHAEDNPLCLEPIASKLQALRNSEKAWRFLDTKQRRKVKVTYQQSGVYDLSSGIYLLSNEHRMRLYTIDLNSLTPNVPSAISNAKGKGKEVEGKPKAKEEIIRWKKVESDKFIVDLGLCVYEHDLIALVTTEPCIVFPGDPPTYQIAITIRQLSTDVPHPRAKSPTIVVMNSLYEKPAVGIEIVGKHLVLILSFNHQDKPQDRVFIYQWMEGVLIASFEAKHRSYAGLVFLTPSLILLPNTNSNSLDVFRIPDAPTFESPKPIVRLGLPKLVDGRVMGVISCRAEPNPVDVDGGSFEEMRKHSGEVRDAQKYEGDGPFASTSTSSASASGPGADTSDDPAANPAVTHDATKVPLGQAFQRATVASAEHALCLFELHILVLQLVMVPGGGLNMHFQFRHRVAFVSPRSSLLTVVLEHEARLKEEDRLAEEKKRAEEEKQRERERDTQERKRMRAAEAGPSRARANSPSVQEFAREGGNTVFGRRDWPPADLEVDDEHEDRPYVPFGDQSADVGPSAGGAGAAISPVTATRTDVAGPGGETSSTVRTGNVMPGTWQADEEEDVYAEGDVDMEESAPQASTSGQNATVEEEESEAESTEIDEDELAFNGSTPVPPEDRTLVPWKLWSPDRTRWFNADAHITHWITTSAGERLVRMADHTMHGAEEHPSDGSGSDFDVRSDGGATIGSNEADVDSEEGEGEGDDDTHGLGGHPARSRIGVPFSVLDFNPSRVAEMRKWVEEQPKPVVRGLKRPAVPLSDAARKERKALTARLERELQESLAARRHPWFPKTQRELSAERRRKEEAEALARREQQRYDDRRFKRAALSDGEDSDRNEKERAFVASDGEAPTMGVRGDGLRRRQRNVRNWALPSPPRPDENEQKWKEEKRKGKQKAKALEAQLEALNRQEEKKRLAEEKRRLQRIHHVLGVWRMHPPRSSAKGKGDDAPPVPAFINTDGEEQYPEVVNDEEGEGEGDGEGEPQQPMHGPLDFWDHLVATHGNTPYVPPPFANSPYGPPPLPNTPFGPPPFTNTPFGPPPFANTPFGPPPFANAPYGLPYFLQHHNPQGQSSASAGGEAQPYVPPPSFQHLNPQGPSSLGAGGGAQSSTDAAAAEQAMDHYLAQFDDVDDEEYTADHEDDDMDIEMDMDAYEEGFNDPGFREMINAIGGHQTDAPPLGDLDDNEEMEHDHQGFSGYAYPGSSALQFYRQIVSESRYLSTGGYRPAKTVLDRPPPDSLWVVPAGDVFESDNIFAEPIINGLPYVMSASRRRYTYDGIMLDEDRVIGTKSNEDTGRVEVIDMHYFA